MASDTKDRLINTASELIWKNSFGSVSVDEICKAANVKKGSFYHFFKSKTDLTIATIEDHFQTSKPRFDEAFSDTLPPEERFKNLARLVYDKQLEALEEFGRVCGCPFATLGSEMAGQEEHIRKKIEEVFSYYIEHTHKALVDLVAEGKISKNVDIQDKAQEIQNYIMGQVMMARIQNSLKPLECILNSGLFAIIGIQSEQRKTA